MDTHGPTLTTPSLVARLRGLTTDDLWKLLRHPQVEQRVVAVTVEARESVAEGAALASTRARIDRASA